MCSVSVITLSIGDLEYTKYTIPRMQKYAKLHQFDFNCIDKKTLPQDISPHWEKYQVANYANSYDKILFLDADIWIQDIHKNIFQEHILYPETFVGRLDIQNNSIGQWIHHDFPLWDSIRKTKTKIGKKPYYNTGCFLFTSDLAYVFQELKEYAHHTTKNRFYDFGEQTALNHILCQYPIRLLSMDKKWNDYRCQDTSYFHHHVWGLKSRFKFPDFRP
jgi:lipopolysaccharide biosynthesis glycosyltransferase